MLEQFSQLENFVFQVTDEFRVGIFVDHGLANDRFRSVCVAKGGERLFVIDVGGGDGGDHRCFRIAT